MRKPAGIMTAFLIVLLGLSCGGDSSPEQDRPETEDTAEETSAVPEETAAPSEEPIPETGEDSAAEVSANPEGSWSTTLGEMEIRVTESGEVEGEYPLGTIQGNLSGTTLEFTYSEGSLSGEGTFVFDDDFDSFTGVQDIESTEIVWDGIRI
ncbi:MAG: hypothetical protein R6U39_02810 [Candidatus Aegiribacteria sp.]